MKPEQISTWIGIATSFAGVIGAFVTMETKLEALEGKMSELYNVEEIRGLEKRLTTLEVTQNNSDVGHLSATIAKIEGEISNVETKISGIKTVDTSEIKSRISNLQSEIERLESQVSRLNTKLSNLKNNSNPLG